MISISVLIPILNCGMKSESTDINSTFDQNHEIIDQFLRLDPNFSSHQFDSSYVLTNKRLSIPPTTF